MKTAQDAINSMRQTPGFGDIDMLLILRQGASQLGENTPAGQLLVETISSLENIIDSEAAEGAERAYLLSADYQQDMRNAAVARGA